MEVNGLKQEVVLRASECYGERLPPQPVGIVLTRVPSIVRSAVRMRFEGRSTARGPHPSWLTAASDIRVLDVCGADDARMVFDCPRLGEAAGELYRQRQLWDTRPDPDVTGLDLVGDVVLALTRPDRDSKLFDQSLLRRLRSLGVVVENGFCGLEVPSTRANVPVIVDRKVIEAADALTRAIPQPMQVRVAGTLDMIRDSTSAFALRLDDGSELQGVLLEGDVRGIAELLGARVVVEGIAVFRPSSNVLRIEARRVIPAPLAPAVWSQMPHPRHERITHSDLVRHQGPRSGLSAILGTWPGEETDAEIAVILEEIS